MKQSLLLLGLCIALVLTPRVHAQTWKPIAPMHVARMEFRALQLNSGKILVAGGEGAWTACELYDPAMDSWEMTGSLHQGRRAFEMQKLPDGRVLIMGGLSPNTTSLGSCEIYDPSTGQWSNTASMANGRHLHGSVVMPDGKIIVTGGMEVGGSIFLQECEEFDPATEKWSSLPPMPIGCYANAPHYSASENKLYVCSGVIGGYGGSYTQDVQVYDFETKTWTAGSPLTVGHADGELQSGITANDSYILFAGRDQPSTTTNVVEYFDQISQSWKMSGTLPAPHWQGMAFPIGADSFIVIGGVADPGPYQQTLSAVSWYSYKDRTAWAGSPMINPRYRFGGLVVDLPYEDPCRDVKIIYVFGGGTPDITNQCEKLVLGPRAITNAIDLEPVRIDLEHSICSQGADTALTVYAASCQPTSLDSVQALVSGVSVKTPPLPYSIAVRDSISIPIHIDAPDGERIPLRLVFRTPVGLIERYIYVTLASGAAGKVTLSVPSVDPRSVCSAVVDSVLLTNASCDPVMVESVTFTGSDRSLFSCSVAGTTVLSNQSTSLFYTLNAITPRTYSATIVIATIANGVRDTLRQAISIQTTGGGAVVGRTVLNDRKVLSGDTVNVPIKLVTTAKSQALGAQIELSYDKDVLELLPPDFTGALADGGEDYDINLTSRGASLYIPGTIRIENGTVVNLRFRTFVAKNSCTTLKLSTLLFSPDDPKFTECVLSANLDSATICIEPQCGDNEIRDYMNGTGPRIMVIRGDHEAALQLHGWRLPTVEVYSILGERMPVDVTTQGEKVTISSDELPSGTYYARVSEGRVVRSIGFAVHR